MSIEVINLRKRFGRTAAVDEVTLSIPDGSLMALVGPSGSGKTTLLRIIAGLELPDSGSVLLRGRDVTRVGVRERGVGFVFQHYALFRHLTVFENISFGLEVRPRRTRPSKAEIRDKVHTLLKLIRLEDLAQRLPSQLSGGQRQRVALARALAVEPQVLLLDEPFGALDAKVRQELRRWLRRLHDEVHITSVFVTHDQEEALEVADQVVVINRGRIEQQGTPEEVYQHPATPFVHHFLGNVNIFHGRIDGGQTRLGELALRPPADAVLDEGSKAVAYVRPHDITISREQGGGTAKATVVQVHATGPLVRIELERASDQQRFEAQITRAQYLALAISAGDAVHFGFSQFQVYASDEADPAAMPHRIQVS
jgi:sulfate transport system ATP-binding protein